MSFTIEILEQSYLIDDDGNVSQTLEGDDLVRNLANGRGHDYLHKEKQCTGRALNQRSNIVGGSKTLRNGQVEVYSIVHIRDKVISMSVTIPAESTLSDIESMLLLIKQRSRAAIEMW